MKYSYIDEKLKKGYKLHAFRSGGGLRVVRLEKGEICFYGESCNFYEALRILNDDVKAGGRKYSDVYGKIETPYMTGSYSNGENLDSWICGGLPFDVKFENDLIIVDMSTKEDTHSPESFNKRAYEGETVYWEVPGLNRLFKTVPYNFPNGNKASCTKPIPSRSGSEAIDERINFQRFSKTDTFDEAISKAEELSQIKFMCEYIEIPFKLGKEKEELLKITPKYNL